MKWARMLALAGTIAAGDLLLTSPALADDNSPLLYEPSQCQIIASPSIDGAVYYCERYEQSTVTYRYPDGPLYEVVAADVSCSSGQRLVAYDGRVVLFTELVWDYFTQPIALPKFLTYGGNSLELSEEVLSPGAAIPLGCLGTG